MSPEAPERRLRPLSIAPDLYETWVIDYRFVREVERLEREGRVKSRGALEMEIGMKAGYLAYVRQGRLSVPAIYIARLKRLYNADYDYILLGHRQLDKAIPLVWDNGKARKLDVYPPFTYEYKKPAGWRIGPMPEEQKEHYPSDPDGKTWQPHPLSPPPVRELYERRLAQQKSPATSEGE